METSHINSLNELDLKARLQTMDWQQAPVAELLPSMVAHIGSLDAELRDHLIYQGFVELLAYHDRIDPDTCVALLHHCLDQSLMHGLGDENSDTVFTRSFTTLLIALLLYRDSQSDYLSDSLIAKTEKKLLYYFNKEQDVRGYVDQKGWAHSIAHGADALDELVQNPKCNQASYSAVLNAVWNKALTSATIYVDDEDERLLTPIFSMLTNGLPLQEIKDLLQATPQQLQQQKNNSTPEAYRRLYCNSKHFLKSFYVACSNYPTLKVLQKDIKECLQQL
ncbi:hypothetical protein A374_16413 [Fictibacillus macauensis ZFHKF-1]|uniref:DUF2785 domain-containing protein n=1 Tax=Fictibacillus macauensis ZFHKF-1 TaxID=1196324 RepID=I8AFH7_9BACL|nr:DUF2785 domain-containing protein [Fictibacillus macauensis]EIT84387.1 hypothetical protein A374_16413 [Fictibacillus macauensis ZFHKF-1]